ncbi:acyl-CoA carboxylase subunit epsilon [Nocardioides marmotae]|uniref:Acyl-CoA carboxylase subunit epsilon n=1 Tax=Nocardioides marmotae TaxID=2663857 RepID=A0A6I3IXB5_9ACTN|nr:acyl-CoA carboxylase subunit epsilon [Nocardioides marmotae]MCR6031384.1 acyl-CoA carboxylase subunit epsilon [Gordonia jinghuaiqii]MBC9735481.1 acyl-CoA carboxylase subunit epsilon [Nocardioides marmotae]MTB86578.1 acyl-CoA carboxylase subunit epsilon [Nocardioides marmotae]MTB95023.1 acyl-CoA carboxylase subunit epsilon [Nocardioides marmotae]QKE02477.1 acyl-CoA carboxylase subunit epsilon [Nocardioides marmotae]
MAADEQTTEQTPGPAESETEPTAAQQEPTRPLLRVVSPHATPEEIAALVAVLTAVGGVEAAAPARRPEWSAPHRGVRRTHPHGPAGWRSSTLPR